MSFNVIQFQELIERTLRSTDPDLASPVAVKLLLGTAAQESHFGTYLHQVKGPAIGAFQMEPATFRDVQERAWHKYPFILGREAADMEWDLRLAIVMARLKYRLDPKPLPNDVLTEIAATWKRVYNTHLGKGTEQEFVDNYVRFVGAK